MARPCTTDRIDYSNYSVGRTDRQTITLQPWAIKAVRSGNRFVMNIEIDIGKKKLEFFIFS